MSSYLIGNLIGQFVVLAIGVGLIIKGGKLYKNVGVSKKALAYCVIGFILIPFKVYSIGNMFYQVYGIPGSSSWSPDHRRGFIDGCAKNSTREDCTCLQQAFESRLTHVELEKLIINQSSPEWQSNLTESLNECGLSNQE